jgi:hypothetical protein
MNVWLVVGWISPRSPKRGNRRLVHPPPLPLPASHAALMNENTTKNAFLDYFFFCPFWEEIGEMDFLLTICTFLKNIISSILDQLLKFINSFISNWL